MPEFFTVSVSQNQTNTNTSTNMNTDTRGKATHLGACYPYSGRIAFFSDMTLSKIKKKKKKKKKAVSQLQREFAKNFGITPVRYLREVRIGVARHLLESSDMGLIQIASQCGFYDQSHLTRHFKSSTGLTPMKYRQRYRG